MHYRELFLNNRVTLLFSNIREIIATSKISDSFNKVKYKNKFFSKDITYDSNKKLHKH